MGEKFAYPYALSTSNICCKWYGDNTSTILYPSMDDTAVVQKIDIKIPSKGYKKIAEVILQPINLNKVAWQ